MGWKYYNHAMIPDCAPHEPVDTTPIDDGSLWNTAGSPLLARWTSDFDCGYEANWWYCLKDTPFDIAALPSKKRYEINKGKKNFTVKEIEPVQNTEGILAVQRNAWASYPEEYRPMFDESKLRTDIQEWCSYRVFGAFSVETNELCAYACLIEHQSWVDFAVLKANPASEKLAVNAAIVAGICEFYSDRLSREFYICDGERNVVHQTYFQDYLIKYFDFRRAYCKLNISYRAAVSIAVGCLYPFRNMIHRHNKSKLFSKIDAVLLMEEISRTGK